MKPLGLWAIEFVISISIQSEAYREVEEIRGVADAKATAIYASAYNRSSQSVEFFEFTRTMQAYKDMIGEGTTIGVLH